MDTYKITIFLYLVFAILHVIVESRSVINEDDLDNLEYAVEKEVDDAMEVIHEIHNIREKLRRNRRGNDDLFGSYRRSRRGNRNSVVALYRYCLSLRRDRAPMDPQCVRVLGGRIRDGSGGTQIFSTDS